jgi:fibronectin-binding autotransporter adhesin
VLRGNFTNNAGTAFNAGSGLVQFLTDANHVLTGTTSFYDVQKLGPNVLTLGTSTNMTVASLLTLKTGLITTGLSNTLYLTNTATQPVVGTGIGAYVSGRLAMTLPNAAASIRVFPVGLSGRYRPVTIKPQGTSTSPVVLVEIFSSPPSGSIDATLSNISANRYYRIQLLSGTIVQPTVQLSFNTDVVDEEVHVPGNLRVAKSNGSAGPWSTAGGSGVYSPDAPRGYTISAAVSTAINSTSYFALASTNLVDNPLTSTVPLPVELLQFTATPKGSAVQLAWATASEKNSAHFLVQRSADGRKFADVVRVEAVGNSSERHNYAALDTAPLRGLSYYRLRQVDTDGSSNFSPVVTINFDAKGETPNLVVYPNPTSGQSFQLLTTNLGATGGKVQIFDNVGRMVHTQQVADGAIDALIKPAHMLASGVYFVTWQATTSMRLTTKVVVE